MRTLALSQGEPIQKLAEPEGPDLVEDRAQRVDACFRCGGRVSNVASPSVLLFVVMRDGKMVQTQDPNER